ncbi:MAG: V4R domain-containing protein [Anaerolineales bacterium]
MERFPPSGFYNSNKFARIFLESIQEITGNHGLNAILNYANLPELVNQMPPDDLEKSFDFSSFAAINQALEEVYGCRGGKGLALRIGRTTFADVLKDYGDLAGVSDIAFKILPLQAKIKFGLDAMARIFSEKSDQTSSVREEKDTYVYLVKRCPICWGRSTAEEPICYYMVGLLKEGLSWVSGGKEFKISEKKCVALGDEACEFVIQKQPVG